MTQEDKFWQDMARLHGATVVPTVRAMMEERRTQGRVSAQGYFTYAARACQTEANRHAVVVASPPSPTPDRTEAIDVNALSELDVRQRQRTAAERLAALGVRVNDDETTAPVGSRP